MHLTSNNQTKLQEKKNPVWTMINDIYDVNVFKNVLS